MTPNYLLCVWLSIEVIWDHLESFEVVYICSSSESQDLSQPEKEITVSKAEETQKIVIIFNQNDNFWPICVKIIVILWICTGLITVTFFWTWDKSRDLSANSQLIEQV